MLFAKLVLIDVDTNTTCICVLFKVFFFLWTAGGPETEEAICEAGGVPALVDLIRNSAEAPDQADLLQPATIALCNLAAGDDARRNAIVDAGALPVLVKLLSHQVRGQRIMAAYIGNLCGQRVCTYRGMQGVQK